MKEVCLTNFKPIQRKPILRLRNYDLVVRPNAIYSAAIYATLGRDNLNEFFSKHNVVLLMNDKGAGFSLYANGLRDKPIARSDAKGVRICIDRETANKISKSFPIKNKKLCFRIMRTGIFDGRIFFNFAPCDTAGGLIVNANDLVKSKEDGKAIDEVKTIFNESEVVGKGQLTPAKLCTAKIRKTRFWSTNR